jgi:hypothetical protein
MKPAYDTDDSDVFAMPTDEQILVFVDEHRAALHHCLDGMSEGQARERLVPSATTLLGLVKHATFAEKVWFGEAFTGLSRSELGIEAGPEESFVLTDVDTIESVRNAHRDACEQSRSAAEGMSLDDVVTGNRRGQLPLGWIYLHMLRELAQHCGHAEILREQILATE